MQVIKRECLFLDNHEIGKGTVQRKERYFLSLESIFGSSHKGYFIKVKSTFEYDNKEFYTDLFQQIKDDVELLIEVGQITVKNFTDPLRIYDNFSWDILFEKVNRGYWIPLALVEFLGIAGAEDIKNQALLNREQITEQREREEVERETKRKEELKKEEEELKEEQQEKIKSLVEKYENLPDGVYLNNQNKQGEKCNLELLLDYYKIDVKMQPKTIKWVREGLASFDNKTSYQRYKGTKSNTVGLFLALLQEKTKGISGEITLRINNDDIVYATLLEAYKGYTESKEQTKRITIWNSGRGTIII